MPSAWTSPVTKDARLRGRITNHAISAMAMQTLRTRVGSLLVKLAMLWARNASKAPNQPIDVKTWVVSISFRVGADIVMAGLLSIGHLG